MDGIPLPPGQQLVAAGKWPIVGERAPADGPLGPLVVEGLVERPLAIALAAWPASEALVDIHCVTRWSKPGVRFAGVSLADVLRAARPLPQARFVSFVAHSARRHSTSLPLDDALQLGTLLTTSADGAPLGVEHGGPLRVVVPGRYFYKSLKWLARIELLAEDRLGYWEGVAGYHNHADPSRQERYVAANLSRQQAAALLAGRNIRGQELLSLAAGGLELTGLDAREALLRNADFRGCRLAGARFDGANLSNAHCEGADLRGGSFAAADVEGADFRGADLRGADFRGAFLTATSFAPANDTDLRPSLPPAQLDNSTRFDSADLAALLPADEAFVRERAGA